MTAIDENRLGLGPEGGPVPTAPISRLVQRVLEAKCDNGCGEPRAAGDRFCSDECAAEFQDETAW